MNVEEIEIDRKKYKVMDTEFNKKETELSSLIIRTNVGHYERIASLMIELGKTCGLSSAIFINPTHGGYIPIQCSKHFNHMFLYKCDSHKSNITNNFKSHGVDNFYLVDDLSDITETYRRKSVVFLDDFIDGYSDFINTYKPIIISKITQAYPDYSILPLTNTNLHVLIPKQYSEMIIKDFKYYIEPNNYLSYDNLINVCIMVKNGGKIFEEMLTKNMPFMDRWTILDTGSTDDTIEIINRVLVGKKKGALFQEPFINFGESRNRCLELAGTQCKYNIMLDDTYVLGGFLKEFLHFVRGDQFTDSFSLYINQYDIEYASNRIFKSTKNLKYLYSIHEVIQDYDNVNVIIPNSQAHIYDIPSTDMSVRTFDRKENDLKLLFEEIKKSPNDPRSYYYVGQTYNLLQNYEKAFEYYLKRGNHPEPGFIQEKVDAFFEAARIANFNLNKPWEECEKLYKRAYELDDSRPESLYFLGIHHFMKGEIDMAYNYLKKGFVNGYPIHRQYCLKPTISFQFLPKLLTSCCYNRCDYETGEKASKLFLEKNKPDVEDYKLVLDWNKIFVNLNKSFHQLDRTIKINYPSKPLCVFVTPGGFKQWTGRDILSEGMGGSETYVVEMARNIQSSGNFQVVVFCDCVQADVFEDVIYRPLEEYFKFVHRNYIHSCFVSRYSEYLPVSLKGQVENVYLLVHDLTLTGRIIPLEPTLKNVFCLTEWHKEYFIKQYPELKDITVEVSHGMDFTPFKEITSEKTPYKFIYSSLANRGLLPLLVMWSKIYSLEPQVSLHIYSDINSNYMISNFPDLMNQIRSLLDSLKDSNVFYYGWVNKPTLMEAWKTSEIWFYPCVYEETFCLTALEAAASRTLAITTDLAALNNTVGDRGVLIKGQPDCIEWLDSTVDLVLKTLKDTDRKKRLIDANYKWVSNLSWKNQAQLMMDKYLLPRKLEFRGMYNWTNNIPHDSFKVFESVINYFKSTHVSRLEPYKVLEIGTYTGTSLIKIVELIPNSVGVGVDMWTNYEENDSNMLMRIEENQIIESFLSNIRKCGLQDRVSGLKNDSTNALANMIRIGEKYDFIYVDGSHKLLDCYSDLILAWQVLNKGGIMGIDDYLWNSGDLLNSPFEGVNHFLKKYEKEMNVLSKEYRVFVEKR
jgi:predicted O-methyltransferase YrrM/tetratricopeptide (TPR) repeat protein